MTSVAWLHISDWHEGRKDFDRDKVRDALVRDISERRRLHARLDRIDFIVFSGDIANTGDENEYHRVQKHFLADVIAASGLDGTCKGRVFMCPGNHDLDRSALTLSRSKHPVVHKNVIQGTISDRRRSINASLTAKIDRDILLEPFENYRRFSRAYLAPDAKDPADPAYNADDPASYAEDPAYYVVNYLSIPSDGGAGRRINVAVACMNSAWLCARIKNPRDPKEYLDYGHLIVGDPQLSAARKRLVRSHLKGVDLKFAVIHHPVSWLDEIDAEGMEETFGSDFHFLLTGHQHSPRANVIESTAGGCVVIPAGACFDKRFPTNPRHISSYNFVRMDAERRMGEVYFRRWTEAPAPGKFAGDESIGYRGVFPFNLPNESIYTDELRRSALQSIISRYQQDLAKRVYESIDVSWHQTRTEIEGVPLVSMTIEGRLIIQEGRPGEVLNITSTANERVKRIFGDRGIDIPPVTVERMEQIIPKPSGEKIRIFPTGNVTSTLITLDAERTIIDYRFRVLETLDGVYAHSLSRAAKQMKIKILKAPGLAYEEMPIGGLGVPEAKKGAEREWFHWVAPGQGYAIQWYPHLHDAVNTMADIPEAESSAAPKEEGMKGRSAPSLSD